MEGKAKKYCVGGESKITELSHVDAETTVVGGCPGIKKLIAVGGFTQILGNPTIEEIIVNLTETFHLGEKAIVGKMQGKAKTIVLTEEAKITGLSHVDAEMTIVTDSAKSNS